MNELYSKISSVADQRITTIPFLNQWVHEGQPISKIRFCELKRGSGLTIDMLMLELYFLWDIEKRKIIFSVDWYLMDFWLLLRGLLNCYAKAKSVEIAVCRAEDEDPSLMQEMEQNGIASDKFEHSIQLSAYTSVSDVEGIEKTLTRMDSDPNFFFNWTTYTVAAKGKKTNEVLRIWKLYKKNEKVCKEAYISIIASILKFRNHLCYGNVIPNFLIDSYSRKGYLRNGQTLKAEEAMKKEEVVSGRRWKPSNESLATCLVLEYLKEEEDLEGFHGAIRA
ncbi:hypothetical protein POTOM_025954 [Populus tomentosa]|uniref:Pentatricopeptide repeat-containing protein n=1 Tax=Populus tomentosa TaxID=118781 RepID=A0A8X7ZM02_POPTO|nr:hypothetical protein POTOM_025954 [Populus tomentosa]